MVVTSEADSVGGNVCIEHRSSPAHGSQYYKPPLMSAGQIYEFLYCCESSGFRGDDYEEGRLLGCYDV
jgi:hypothetical protein